MRWPLVVVLPASKTADNRSAGISMARARLAGQIHACPILADDTAPSLDTLALAAEHWLHEAPCNPADLLPGDAYRAAPGKATFHFTGAEYILISDVEMSVRLEFECPAWVAPCWKNPPPDT